MKPVAPHHNRQLDKITNTILKLRIERGFSQRDLSDISQVHYTTIAKVESGSGHYSLPTLLQLSKCLRIKLSSILELSEL